MSRSFTQKPFYFKVRQSMYGTYGAAKMNVRKMAGVWALVFLILVPVFASHAQEGSTKYFKDRNLAKEVPPERARFSQTVSHDSEGRTTTEVKDLVRNEIVSRETVKGDEPFGVWLYKPGEEPIYLNYEFDLVYSDEKFEENEFTRLLDNFFEDDDSLGFKAPVIESGEKNVVRFVVNNLFFPVRAREEGLQGKVYVGFRITEEAKVDEFVVYKGANVLLDKEAVRTMRMLKLKSPPMVQGKPKAFRLMLPISFTIQ